MTELDTALESLKQDADNPEKQSDFYNLFLNTVLYLPSITEVLPSPGAEAREVTLPMIVPAEGREYFVLFDREERLYAWAGKEVPFLEIPGHSVADFSPSSFHWVLNPGTGKDREFIPEEIDWLKKVIAAHKSVQGGANGEDTACKKS